MGERCRAWAEWFRQNHLRHASQYPWQLNLARCGLVIPLLSNRIWWKLPPDRRIPRQTQLFMSSVREDVAFGPANLGVSGAELYELVERTLEQVGAAGYGDRNPII